VHILFNVWLAGTTPLRAMANWPVAPLILVGLARLVRL
jgi:hypothetical protein